jgi:hypothetical protein
MVYAVKSKEDLLDNRPVLIFPFNRVRLYNVDEVTMMKKFVEVVNAV